MIKKKFLRENSNFRTFILKMYLVHKLKKNKKILGINKEVRVKNCLLLVIKKKKKENQF